MTYPLNDLGAALTAQIYQTVMGGDDKVKPNDNTFFTWVTPGLPFSAEDLDFCSKGIFEIPGAILDGGTKLPRSDARVQAVFRSRRDYAHRALRAYEGNTP